MTSPEYLTRDDRQVMLKRIEIAPHGYSIERLYRFSCGCCNRWWSIGDFELIPDQLLHCPHCGAERPIESLPKD